MKKREIFFILISLILTTNCFQFILKPELKSIDTNSEEVSMHSSGDILPTFGWKQNWAGPLWDVGMKMAIDSSDNIHITGYSEELNDNEDFLYLKYNDEGTLMNSVVWDQGNEANVGRDIILDSSNNIYIVGYTDVNPDVWIWEYDTYIRKLSSGGSTQWTRTWGGSENDIARATALDSFGNVYLGGLTWSYGAGQADSLLIKYSNTGTLQWNETYGSTTSEWVNSLIIDSFDNIYLAGGYQYNDTTDSDSYLIKVDNNGVEQWSRSWGGVGDEIGVSVALDSSQNVYVVGSTSSYGAGY
ncbi:MAG: SBBP repeat-containing protein, partial [Promethearchaeota archaeon]